MKVHELFEDEERSILSVLGEQDDVFACQEELLEAGLEDFAKL